MTDVGYCHWVSGFADGESCFHLKVLKRNGTTLHKLSASFQIGLRADDLPILQRIKDYFGYGYIRPYKTVAVNPHIKSSPRFYFYIDTLDGATRGVIRHFDKYPLRSRKARDYLVYKEAVLLMNEVSMRQRGSVGGGRSRRWTKADIDRFVGLKRDLEEGRIFKEMEIQPISWKGPADGAALVHTYKLDRSDAR